MIFLIAVIVVLLAVLLLRLHFEITCTDAVTLRLRILCLRIPLYPTVPKKVNPAKFKRGYPKEKEKKTPAEKKVAPAKQQEKIPLGEKIETVRLLVQKLCKKLFKHLRLDLSHIMITVGGEDAARTAVTYGIVSQGVAYLLSFLDAHLKVRKKRHGEIAVCCDFTAAQTTCDIRIAASLTVWQLLDIGISLAYNYLKGKDIFNLKKS